MRTCAMPGATVSHARGIALGRSRPVAHPNSGAGEAALNQYDTRLIVVYDVTTAVNSPKNDFAGNIE